MTNEEAWDVVSVIAVALNGFDDPKVELWIRKVKQLADVRAATAVADRIVDTHTSPGAPLWSTFLQAYRSEVRTEAARTRGLPEARERRMSFAEFIRLTRDKAEQGDGEANRQLATLDRIANRKRTGAPKWIDALAQGDST